MKKFLARVATWIVDVALYLSKKLFPNNRDPEG